MIKLLIYEQIITINKKICLDFKHMHHCIDVGKIDSAINSADAFYNIINGCAQGDISKETIIAWYDRHKVKYL